MALGQAGRLSCATLFFGVLSFVLGIVAENKKPAAGSALQQGDLTVCIYADRDPYIPLGAFSAIFLAVAWVLGLVSIFFPYNKKAVPLGVLCKSSLLVVFGLLSCVIFLVAEALLMWTIIIENFHRINAVHTTPHCPTAKTGLMGGAAFLALDATLFWLVCQMLTLNAREDHFDEQEDDAKGESDAIINTLDGHPPHPAAAKA